MCAPAGLHRRHVYHRCLHCCPGRYVRLVQHLIEKCLTFRMDRDQCVRALATHARIPPLVTIAVWDELLKENPSFFCTYFKTLPNKSTRNELPPTI